LKAELDRRWANYQASLDAQAGRHLTDAKRRELDRRLAEHEAALNDVVSWEQVKTEALKRFRK
jgi:putative addiction module component (TIGR02574 family)